MKIVFMGTPDFAIPSLKILLKNNHQILAVVTTTDKERGRGQKVTFTAVKQFAVENNIPVYQPEKLKGKPANFAVIAAIVQPVPFTSRPPPI